MKHPMIWLLTVGGLLVAVGKANTQTCFMIDTQGRQIDLGDLCGVMESSPAPSLAPTPTVHRSNPSSPAIWSIPIKRRAAGIPVVEVMLTHSYKRQTIEMLWDTGASVTVLPPELAKNLNLEPKQILEIHTASGTAMAVKSSVDKIQVGNQTIQNATVVVVPGVPMALLGQNLYPQHSLTIGASAIQLQPFETP